MARAIKARASAKENARAATLAAKALERYPSDDATAKLAKETIDKLAPSLQKVKVACTTPCKVNAAGTAVPGDPTTRWTIYVDPGDATVGALDQNSIFYIESRGIPRNEAERMIALAFFEPALNRFPTAKLREDLRGALAAKLQ